MSTLTAEQVDTANAIADVADEGGTIQATEMLDLCRAGHVPNDPRYHTTMSLTEAFRLAGLPDDTAERLWG